MQPDQSRRDFLQGGAITMAGLLAVGATQNVNGAEPAAHAPHGHDEQKHQHQPEQGHGEEHKPDEHQHGHAAEFPRTHPGRGGQSAVRPTGANLCQAVARPPSRPFRS